MSVLLHSKSLKSLFLNNFRLLFHTLPTKFLFTHVIFMNLSFENVPKIGQEVLLHLLPSCNLALWKVANNFWLTVYI